MGLTPGVDPVLLMLLASLKVAAAIAYLKVMDIHTSIGKAVGSRGGRSDSSHEMTCSVIGSVWGFPRFADVLWLHSSMLELQASLRTCLVYPIIDHARSRLFLYSFSLIPPSGGSSRNDRSDALVWGRFEATSSLSATPVNDVHRAIYPDPSPISQGEDRDGHPQEREL